MPTLKDPKLFVILSILFVLFFLFWMEAKAETITFSGYVQPDDNWRFSTGLTSERLTVDWFRMAKDGTVSDGYDLTASRKVWLAETQYKHIHRSEKAVDTQELALTASKHGVGVGIARSWLGSFDSPKWLVKAKYRKDWRALSLYFDWSSNFGNRGLWSVAPRVNIPAWKFLSFVLKGKYEKSRANGKEKEWWSVDGGVVLDIKKEKTK